MVILRFYDIGLDTSIVIFSLNFCLWLIVVDLEIVVKSLVIFVDH